MQQRLIISILIALVIALVFFNVGKISQDSTTGFSISSNTITLTVSPKKVFTGEKIYFTVEPHGGKYYTSIDVFKKQTKGLGEFVANLEVETAYGACRLCKYTGTAELKTSGFEKGNYYAQVLPVGAKNPVTEDFTIE